MFVYDVLCFYHQTVKDMASLTPRRRCRAPRAMLSSLTQPAFYVRTLEKKNSKLTMDEIVPAVQKSALF